MEGKTVAEREDRQSYIQTDIDLDDYRVVVLALTGPPAAGKSTAVKMLRDMGIPCKDTGEAIRERARERYDGAGEPDEDYIWNTAELVREEHGAAGPTAITKEWIQTERAHGHEVLCVSSLREEAELSWLRHNIGATLCARIDAPFSDRAQRYIDMKLDTDGSISKDDEIECKNELSERELRETPYPPHDVTIENTNSMRTNELWHRLESVVEVLDE